MVTACHGKPTSAMAEEQQRLQGFALDLAPSHETHEDRNGTSEPCHIAALLHLVTRSDRWESQLQC